MNVLQGGTDLLSSAWPDLSMAFCQTSYPPCCNWQLKCVNVTGVMGACWSSAQQVTALKTRLSRSYWHAEVLTDGQTLLKRHHEDRVTIGKERRAHTRAWAPSCTCQRPSCRLWTTGILGDKCVWEREAPISDANQLLSQSPPSTRTQINTHSHTHIRVSSKAWIRCCQVLR